MHRGKPRRGPARRRSGAGAASGTAATAAVAPVGQTTGARPQVKSTSSLRDPSLKKQLFKSSLFSFFRLLQVENTLHPSFSISDALPVTFLRIYGCVLTLFKHRRAHQFYSTHVCF